MAGLEDGGRGSWGEESRRLQDLEKAKDRSSPRTPGRNPAPDLCTAQRCPQPEPVATEILPVLCSPSNTLLRGVHPLWVICLICPAEDGATSWISLEGASLCTLPKVPDSKFSVFTNAYTKLLLLAPWERSLEINDILLLSPRDRGFNFRVQAHSCFLLLSPCASPDGHSPYLRSLCLCFLFSGCLLKPPS